MDLIRIKTVTAKTLIRALAGSALAIWAITNIYMFSSKPSLLVYDYHQNLQADGQKISKEIAAIAKINPHSEQLISLCRFLCEIKLCQKDPLGKDDLSALFDIADDTINNSNRSQLNLFAGNIYREYGNYDLAKSMYQRSISSATDNLKNISKNLGLMDSPIMKARNLNNLGVLYYLQGKTASSKKGQSMNYLLAKEYFAQANTITPASENKCLSKTIQNNISQCSWELKFTN